MYDSSDGGVADLRAVVAAVVVRISIGVLGGDVEGLVEAMARVLKSNEEKKRKREERNVNVGVNVVEQITLQPKPRCARTLYTLPEITDTYHK